MVELSPSEKKVAEMKPETEKRSEYEYVYPQTTTISILHTSSINTSIIKWKLWIGF